MLDDMPTIRKDAYNPEKCQCFPRLCAKVEVHKSAMDSISQLILGLCCNTDGASRGNSGSSRVGICLESRRVAETNVRVSFVLLWRSTKHPWRWDPTILHIINLHLGRGKDAISSCSEALELDGELIDALVQRGESKLLTEDWEGAIADLKEAAEKPPQILKSTVKNYQKKRSSCKHI